MRLAICCGFMGNARMALPGLPLRMTDSSCWSVVPCQKDA